MVGKGKAKTRFNVETNGPQEGSNLQGKMLIKAFGTQTPRDWHCHWAAGKTERIIHQISQ